jgi:hypothetical protein
LQNLIRNFKLAQITLAWIEDKGKLFIDKKRKLIFGSKDRK